MCAPTQLYHPSKHKWRRMKKCGLQLWILEHARHILTVTTICYCLCPVAAGLSERCFPGRTNCGIGKPLFFYSNFTRLCYGTVSWTSCGDNGFSTREECKTACEGNGAGEVDPSSGMAATSMTPPSQGFPFPLPPPGTDSSMESPTPGEMDPLSATSATPPSQGLSFPLPLPAASEVTLLVSTATSTDPTPSMSPDSGTAIPDLCFLSPVNSLCIPPKHHVRYFYKSEDNECIEFIFFGCNGNENNFLTREECLATCGRKTTKRTATSTVYAFQTTEPLAVSPSTTFPTPSSTSHMTSHMIIPMSTNVVVQLTQTNLPLPPTSLTHEPIGTGIATGQSTTSEVTMTTSHEISLVALTTTDMPTSTATTSTVVTTPAIISPPTTEPDTPSEQPSTAAEAPALSVFDYASIGVGLLALCLIVLLFGIMAMVVYRYRRRLKENAVIKQVNPTLSGPAYGHNSAKESSHSKQTNKDYYDYRCENLYTTV